MDILSMVLDICKVWYLKCSKISNSIIACQKGLDKQRIPRSDYFRAISSGSTLPVFAYSFCFPSQSQFFHFFPRICITHLFNTISDSLTIFGLWVLGLAVSHINEFNCKLMSPEHYFNDNSASNTIASWDSEIKTFHPRDKVMRKRCRMRR